MRRNETKAQGPLDRSHRDGPDNQRHHRLLGLLMILIYFTPPPNPKRDHLNGKIEADSALRKVANSKNDKGGSAAKRLIETVYVKF